ncbi:CBS-domain-containing protein [Backusella circina FSU 941]|nr:CBS-domain-containing protein [Backusella circina FSU 941]
MSMSTTKRPGSRIPSVVTTNDPPSNGSRQRQSKRDEAIRKKLEQELSKKKSGSKRVRQTRKIAGTVSALRPAQALTVKENMLVIEASQLMAAKRSDCVLVVDEDDHLSGIFTSKDLAYRVVADSLDARNTSVAQIMTKGPMCVTSDTSGTDALNLMVSRGFRHLPVCNEEGDIFGLLDITKCLYEALDKMERAFGSSRKLYDALEGVEREWSHSPIQLVQYMEALREKMECPDLNSVLDGLAPAEVNVKTNVRDVARMMKEYRTTAVLVTDRDGLAGIFTTKDVVLRVIAAGLNPENCSVVRVMTPHPDTAPPSMSIMDALRKMHDGHYLNLPVTENGDIVGIVDVLKLTYATLEQINSIQGGDGEGPMWSRFWDSFGSTDQHESESQLSDPLSSQMLSTHSGRDLGRAISPEPSASFSQLQGFSEITPNESASMVNNEESRSLSSSHNHHPEPKENMFSFKFTTASGKTHRIASSVDSYSQLVDSVCQKVIGEHMAHVDAEDVPVDSWLSISYLDDEEDQVLITSDADVSDAVSLARKMGQSRVKLFVHDSTERVPEVPDVVVEPPVEAPKPVVVEKEEVVAPKPRARKQVEEKPPAEPGFPQELILPAAIAFLGVVIIGVFAFSRVSPQHR